MSQTALADGIIVAAFSLAIGFRWGMGRLANAIDDFRESWEKLNGLRDRDETEEPEKHPT
jgi:hypothetical protein